MRADRSAESQTELARRKAKKLAEGGTSAERLAKLIKEAKSLIIKCTSKPVGPVTITHKGTPFTGQEVKGQVSIEWSAVDPEAPFVFKACGKTTEIPVEEVVLMSPGAKKKLGLKKYLIFENVSSTYDKKSSSLHSIMAQSLAEGKVSN